MKTQQIHTATIEKLSHDLRGIARIDGKATFIKEALPGEKVTFTYTKRKKDFDEGRLIDVLNQSDIRTTPPCPHAEICGGCSLQHIRSDAQVELKEKIFLELLERTAKCVPESVFSPITGPTTHYRYKARISVRYVQKKQMVCIGFREKHQPRYVANLTQCLVLEESLSRHWLSMRLLVEALDDPMSIAQIEVAADEKSIALIFRHLSKLTITDYEKLHAFALQTGFKVFLQSGGPDTVHPLDLTNGASYLRYHLKDFNIIYDFDVTDFTQINPVINEKMVAQAINWLELTAQDRVLDLFCGLGNFTLPMARFAKEVVGVEGSETMVKRAFHNAGLNQITNINFFSENLETTSVFEKLKGLSFDKILLDPPRAGAYTLVKSIEHLNPRCILYVSCNPITFARDAQILIHEKGYRLKQVCVMDMFPHTEHVESMALFVLD